MYDPDGDGDGSVKDGMKLSTDVDTLRNCALRETFEETGILPLKPGTAHGAGGGANERTLFDWSHEKPHGVQKNTQMT